MALLTAPSEISTLRTLVRSVWLLCLLSVGCSDCNPSGNMSAPDASEDEDATMADAGMTAPSLPGQRPTLSSPGEIVPLLWGRVVELKDEANDATVRFALDDPSQAAYQRFFGALDAACAADFAAEIAQPSGISTTPNCEAYGAHQARLHLCRARAGAALVAGDGAGLVELAPNEPRLKLPDAKNAGKALWTALSSDAVVRASFALFAVAELREAIGRASLALDPASCELLSSEHASLLARTLREASADLSNRTQTASSLLRLALSQVHKAAPDDETTRIRVTRALNHSLLEEQKLYAGIPYASFSPLDESEDALRDDRYPALLTAPNERTARAATLIARSQTRFMDDQGKIESSAALVANFVTAVRADQPLRLGHLSPDDLTGVLSRLDLTASDLDAGAALLAAHGRVSGVPSARLTSLDVEPGLHVLRSDLKTPQAYVNAITAALATRVDENLASYARRGLHHALDAARLAALRAQERSELPADAIGDLTELARTSTEIVGTLQVCQSPDRTTVRPLGPADKASSASLELWSGELGAGCALAADCDDEPYRIPSTGDGFTISTTRENARFYLTVRGQDSEAKQARGVAASLAAKPLDPSTQPRCFFEPLVLTMHEKMRNLHDREALPVVPRSPPTWSAGSEITSAASDPVSATLGRSLSGRNAASEAILIELDQPFSSERLELERALETLCDLGSKPYREADVRECGALGMARASGHECRARWAREAAARNANSLVLGKLTLELKGEAHRRALRLLAWEERKLALVTAADVIDASRCTASVPSAATASAARTLLSRLLAEAQSELPDLLAELEAEADTLAATEMDAAVRRVRRSRGLTASSLASARLLLTAPYAAYEPDPQAGQASDPFDHALSRFPVVTRHAILAEDARAERLLRESKLQPWLADLTVQAGVVDRSALEGAWSGSVLATRLRSRLVALHPETYGVMPSDAGGFMAALGISSTQLRNAAVRMAQTAEVRGLSLLPVAGTSPALTVASAALFPAPQGSALAALGEGKLRAAPDALPNHFALRGHYHVVARVASALAHAHATAEGSALDALRAELNSQIEDRIVIEQLQPLTSEGALAIERTLAANVTDAQGKVRTRIVFSDSGLTCALTGQVAGEACTLSDYLLDDANVSLRVLSGAADSTRRVRLEGYRLPANWDLRSTQELSAGRVYAIDQIAKKARPLAGITLSPAASLPTRHETPRSDALDLSVLELLAFKAPGEGCAACRPRSICESTGCDLDVCVRVPAVNGKTCGAVAVCEDGACSEEGCGDGARADGTGTAPYEVCDDGNQNDNDGCSASCLPELRDLEPSIKEGWPSGPATALGVDGLGQQLLVYTADALEGENQLIRAASLDAFGVQSGSERTLDAALPRVFISEPSVAGLRDGGFAVVYGSPDISGTAGIGVRIVSSTGSPGSLLRVDDGNTTAGSARVASVEDGFVVVWSERSGSALLSRVRARRFDAQGAAIGSSFEVARASNLTDQVEPTVASSLGQILITWSERDAERGTALSIRARRFSPFGSAVDGDAFEVSLGQNSEPSVAVLASDDYLIAWTSRDVDTHGDISRRRVQRFGLPLAVGEAEPWLTGASAQARPVVAGLGSDAVVAYQTGSPSPITALASAAVADENAADDLAALLAGARERDVSAVHTPLGVWFVWSKREAQGRSLFAYLLPSSQTP